MICQHYPQNVGIDLLLVGYAVDRRDYCSAASVSNSTMSCLFFIYYHHHCSVSKQKDSNDLNSFNVDIFPSSLRFSFKSALPPPSGVVVCFFVCFFFVVVVVVVFKSVDPAKSFSIQIHISIWTNEEIWRSAPKDALLVKKQMWTTEHKCNYKTRVTSLLFSKHVIASWEQ